jgi:hypothetical protein
MLADAGRVLWLDMVVASDIVSVGTVRRLNASGTWVMHFHRHNYLLLYAERSTHPLHSSHTWLKNRRKVLKRVWSSSTFLLASFGPTCSGISAMFEGSI